VTIKLPAAAMLIFNQLMWFGLISYLLLSADGCMIWSCREVQGVRRGQVVLLHQEGAQARGRQPAEPGHGGQWPLERDGEPEADPLRLRAGGAREDAGVLRSAAKEEEEPRGSCAAAAAAAACRSGGEG
jgi:hypothetical protein